VNKVYKTNFGNGSKCGSRSRSRSRDPGIQDPILSLKKCRSNADPDSIPLVKKCSITAG